MKTFDWKSVLCSLAIAATTLFATGCATTAEKEAPSLAEDDETRGYFEVLRSDLNATKIRTLNQVMQLTPDEAEKFWPIYRRYEQELAAVSDRKLALIREFFGHYKAGTLNDANSSDIATRWLQNVQDRLDLWKQYHQKISESVSPKRAGQFLQAENQMALFVDINIASEMPLLRSPPANR